MIHNSFNWDRNEVFLLVNTTLNKLSSQFICCHKHSSCLKYKPIKGKHCRIYTFRKVSTLPFPEYHFMIFGRFSKIVAQIFNKSSFLLLYSFIFRHFDNSSSRQLSTEADRDLESQVSIYCCVKKNLAQTLCSSQGGSGNAGVDMVSTIFMSSQLELRTISIFSKIGQLLLMGTNQ